MTVIKYRKVKCDECGKEEIVKESGSYPNNWLVVDVVEWSGNTGQGRLNKEVCSEKCAINFMNKLKEIPKIKTSHIY